MNTIGEQIKKYRILKGITQKDVANALGESSGRVIYNWEKGISRPDCEKLARLCDTLEVSADELIGCKSMCQRPTTMEWNVLQKYRALDAHGKLVVDYLIESEYCRVMTTTKKKTRMLKINYYSLPASAGTGNFLDSEFAEEILIPETDEADQADFVISVSGDSMKPTYCDGDKVFVKQCNYVDIGEIGIFVVNGNVYIKERGDYELISHNQGYNPIILTENDSVYCCGRVLGVVSD